jgi:serine/threonine-protein kinase
LREESVSDAPLPIPIGSIIDGKYRLERVIGSGGMGVVMAAEHLKLGKTVALKFLLRHACENREAVSRFLREGQALARITSAHVARVMDVGTLEGGEPYIVMEYLEGSDLGVVLRKRGPLPIADAVGYLLEACEAVAEAHANGIVHRDLKPSNLFLSESADGLHVVKVLDFGISKAVVQREGPTPFPVSPAATTAPPPHDTNTGALVGSPLYMSPEQIRNARRVDERTDIWALGVILHELLAGKPPFEGETLAGTLAAVAADPPDSLLARRSGVPPGLEAVTLRCLQKAPERRYSSVASLARALEPFGPPDSRSSVDRIARLLRDNPGVARVDSLAGSSGEAIPTLPSWEGDTIPISSLGPLWQKRRWVVGAAAATGMLISAAVFLKPSSPSGRSPVPDRDASLRPEPRTAAPSLPSNAAPVESATAISSVGSGPQRPFATSLGGAPGVAPTPVRQTATPRSAPAARPSVPGRPATKEKDGTEDRK